jgi:quercetin dioxygenase-like cupin family protein
VREPDRVRVLDADRGPALDIVEGAGSARAVVWPGVGADLRSMQIISLEAGARTVTLRHPGEAVYYVLGGAGEATDGVAPDGQPIAEGSMVHVGPDTAYAFLAGPGGLELVGGPSPADPALYEGIAEATG